MSGAILSVLLHYITLHIQGLYIVNRHKQKYIKTRKKEHVQIIKNKMKMIKLVIQFHS